MAKAQVGPNQVALTGADLLAAPNLKRLEIPELSRGGVVGVVFVRPPNAGDVVKFISVPEADRLKATIGLVAGSIVDENGADLFNPAQVERLAEMDMRVFSRLSGAVIDLVNKATASMGGEKGSAGNASGEPGETTGSGSRTN